MSNEVGCMKKRIVLFCMLLFALICLSGCQKSEFIDPYNDSAADAESIETKDIVIEKRIINISGNTTEELRDQLENMSGDTYEKLLLNDDGSIKYIPIVKRGHCIRKADQNESKKILNAFFERSKDIKIEGFIDEKYSELAEENIAKYIMYLSGERKNVIIRIINKLTGYRLQKRISDRYREKMGISVRNYIECEAHRELLLKGLED